MFLRHCVDHCVHNLLLFIMAMR